MTVQVIPVGEVLRALLEMPAEVLVEVTRKAFSLASFPKLARKWRKKGVRLETLRGALQLAVHRALTKSLSPLLGANEALSTVAGREFKAADYPMVAEAFARLQAEYYGYHLLENKAPYVPGMPTIENSPLAPEVITWINETLRAQGVAKDEADATEKIDQLCQHFSEFVKVELTSIFFTRPEEVGLTDAAHGEDSPGVITGAFRMQVSIYLAEWIHSLGAAVNDDKLLSLAHWIRSQALNTSAPHKKIYLKMWRCLERPYMEIARPVLSEQLHRYFYNLVIESV